MFETSPLPHGSKNQLQILQTPHNMAQLKGEKFLESGMIHLGRNEALKHVDALHDHQGLQHLHLVL